MVSIDAEKKGDRKQKDREDKQKQARFEKYKRSCIQCVMRREGTVITFPDNFMQSPLFGINFQ